MSSKLSISNLLNADEPQKYGVSHAVSAPNSAPLTPFASCYAGRSQDEINVARDLTKIPSTLVNFNATKDNTSGGYQASNPSVKMSVSRSCSVGNTAAATPIIAAASITADSTRPSSATSNAEGAVTTASSKHAFMTRTPKSCNYSSFSAPASQCSSAKSSLTESPCYSNTAYSTPNTPFVLLLSAQTPDCSDEASKQHNYDPIYDGNNYVACHSRVREDDSYAPISLPVLAVLPSSGSGDSSVIDEYSSGEYEHPKPFTNTRGTKSRSSAKRSKSDGDIDKKDRRAIMAESKRRRASSSAYEESSVDDESSQKLLKYRNLSIARKRHYTPKLSATAIQKRTGSKRPQGRPFTQEMEARFFHHRSIKDLFCNEFKKPVAHFADVSDIKFENSIIKASYTRARYTATKRVTNNFCDVNFSNKNLKRACIDNLITKEFNPDVHSYLTSQLGFSKITFVKVMRDGYGKIVKLETFRPNEADNNQYPENFLKVQSDEVEFKAKSLADLEGSTFCSPLWVKKTIAFPRYKSKMKIHVIEGIHDFLLYTNAEMLHWDLEIGNIKNNPHKKVILHIDGQNSLEKYLNYESNNE